MLRRACNVGAAYLVARMVPGPKHPEPYPVTVTQAQYNELRWDQRIDLLLAAKVRAMCLREGLPNMLDSV